MLSMEKEVCPMCRKETQMQLDDDPLKRTCPLCGAIYYNDKILKAENGYFLIDEEVAGYEECSTDN